MCGVFTQRLNTQTQVLQKGGDAGVDSAYTKGHDLGS